MEYAKIDIKIPYKVGQKVAVRDTYTQEVFKGVITRIDMFQINTYNLHVKINLNSDINDHPIYSEAVVYPQPEYNFGVKYEFAGVIDED